MIIGIGCDLAEVSRIKRALGMKGFAARVFTQREQDYCMARGAQAYASFAARFAAKEAFVKAIGTGLTEIEVINDALGRPQLVLYGYFKDYAKGLGTEKIHLTLSHTKELAMAQVILEG
mgnify:CR=1 FL=1